MGFERALLPAPIGGLKARLPRLLRFKAPGLIFPILETQQFISKIEPETHPRSLGPKEASGCPRKMDFQADLRLMVA